MKDLKELLTETKNSSIYLGSDYIQGNESKINDLISLVTTVSEVWKDKDNYSFSKCYKLSILFFRKR